MKTVKDEKLRDEFYRRTGTERRGWAPMPQVPFIDSDGNIVTHDRRSNMDRRDDADAS